MGQSKEEEQKALKCLLKLKQFSSSKALFLHLGYLNIADRRTDGPYVFPVDSLAILSLVSVSRALVTVGMDSLRSLAAGPILVSGWTCRYS